MEGRIILNQYIIKGITQIDVTQQKPGMYYLRLIGDNQIKIRKIVVQNH